MNEYRNALRYGFAKRCFLDIADHDYIAARTLFKNSCKDQSLIFMQQCIEKYLKAILLYNKTPSNNDIKKSNHYLTELLKRCRDNIDDFNLSEDVIRFIQELSGVEHSRYLTYSYYGVNHWLFELDKCVWQLRVYAQPNIPRYKESIKKFTSSDPDKYFGKPIILSGELEKIFGDLTPENKILRGNLIWKNWYYGIKKKRVVKNVKLGSWAKNSPFSIGTDGKKKLLYEAIKDFVYIPKNLRKELDKL